MKLKRFEALTLQEALQAVKAELGLDAVIVSTRRITKNGGLFGLLTQRMVEVTAAVDPPKNVEQPSQLPIPEMVTREVDAQERLERIQSWYEPPKEEVVDHGVA
jgi:flagellar biosynthesis protein FlhF